MAINLTTTREAAALHGVKMMVFGKAGVGKTTLCATAPTPIIISVESGLLSLRDRDIPVIEAKTFEDLEEAYTFVTESEHAKDFETICLDSITEIAEVVLANEKAKSADPRQAYGELQVKMMDICRAFRDIKGKNVYFSAKQTSVKDDMSGITTYGVSMPGAKLGPQMPYLFDEVMCLRAEKDEKGAVVRSLQCFTDLQYDCKDRSGVLDPYEVPDLSVIVNKISKGE